MEACSEAYWGLVVTRWRRYSTDSPWMMAQKNWGLATHSNEQRAPSKTK
jgi:hypothetical protein